MSQTTFWLEDPDYWDNLEVEGFLFLDTKVDIDGGLKNDFDLPKASGKDGARAKHKGYVPSKIKVAWLLYTLEHFEAYEGLLTLAQPQPGKKSSPVVAVKHPLVQLHGQERFHVEQISILKFIGQGQWQAQFELIEWFPEPKTTPKPKVKDPSDGPKEGRRAGLVQEYQQNKPSKTAIKP